MTAMSSAVLLCQLIFTACLQREAWEEKKSERSGSLMPLLLTATRRPSAMLVSMSYTSRLCVLTLPVVLSALGGCGTSTKPTADGTSQVGGGPAAGGSPTDASGGFATGGSSIDGAGGHALTGGAPPTGGTDGGGGTASGGTAGSGGSSSGGTNAGGTGGAGTGGQSPTGAHFPFPQNVKGEYCIFPSSYDNADVRAAYELWKETVVTSEGASGHLRVRKPDSGSQIDSTVSEGIGYGLLLAVYMDDQSTFDEIWKYEQLYLNENGLMHWEISKEGTVIGTGAALDGDEDMAWALVMADRQWGGQGSLDRTYIEYAIDLINAMWEHEIDHTRNDMPLPGDGWGNADITNISYFAPAYYRVFGQVTGQEEAWNRVIDTSYTIIEASLSAQNGNADNGLVPAWCTSSGEPVEAFSGAPLHFQNDSTRTPFRVGQDYCYYGEPRALSYMEKITSFYLSVGVDNIVDGYELDGTPRPDFGTSGLGSASFVGPAAVGASYGSAGQAFVDEAYAALITQELTAGTIYYQKSWAALSLLMMTGGFYEFPAAE